MSDTISVRINGHQHVLRLGATLVDALRQVDVDPQRGGIAVALDAVVIPCADWTATRLEQGAQIDIVTAAQGG